MNAPARQTRTAPRTPRGGPKPSTPYTVEGWYHLPLEQEDGEFLELVLPLRIGYRKMQKFMAEVTGPVDSQLEQLCEQFSVDMTALDNAADYVDVLVGAQAYFDAFQDMAVARLGELQGSSDA